MKRKNRKKLIGEEYEYLESLREQLPDEKTKTQFRKAVEWPYHRSESYRTMDYVLNWLQIIITFVISALGAFQTLQGDYLGVAIIIISLISPVLTGIKSKCKSFENWKRYRDELEELKSLTRRYLHEIEPFKLNDADGNKRLYLLLLDNIIAKETSGWQTMRAQDEKTQQKKDE